VLRDGLLILALTLYVEMLELLLERMGYFIRSPLFWFGLGLRYAVCCLTAYLLYQKIPEWFLVVPLSVFLGIGAISNTNVTIAGVSLIPIASFFADVRSKMKAQAAEYKFDRMRREAEQKDQRQSRAHLAERLQRLPADKLKDYHRTCLLEVLGERGYRKAEKVLRRAKPEETVALLAHQLVTLDWPCVEKRIAAWEKEAAGIDNPPS
jgi:hypothetical protein